MEKLMNEYFILGNALNKLYNGELLTNEESELIAGSPEEECMLALHFVTIKKLELRKDKSLDNFNENMNKIRIYKFNNQKNKSK